MNTAHNTSRIANTESKFRIPHYDCQQHADSFKLVVYVPGVVASGVDITVRGPDITITARKPHYVRENWQALHLERVQYNYELRLRIGTGYDHAAMSAEINDGVLTVLLPRRVRSVATKDAFETQLADVA